MKKFFLSWHDSVKNTGGVKAKEDTDITLEKSGFRRINAPKNKILKFFFVYFLFPCIVRGKKGSVFFLQYPSGTPNVMDFLVNSIKKKKRNTLIMLVHDVEALRLHFGDEFDTQNRRELNLLAKADGLIVLNEKMEIWLEKKGIRVPMVNLEVWDYRSTIAIKEEIPFNNSICFAGNLKKSTFLTKLYLKHKIYLYGIKDKQTLFYGNSKYEGTFPPEVLPQYLKGNWGLVWDGDSLDSCIGKYGEYLKYNNPHKVSLYLSSGIPVIVWSGAAIADFVKSTGTGILIDNLGELEKVLDNIDECEYRDIRSNVKQVSYDMRNGEYLRHALYQMRETLNCG